MDPDQTAPPRGAVCSGSTMFVCLPKLVIQVSIHMQQTTSTDAGEWLTLNMHAFCRQLILFFKMNLFSKEKNQSVNLLVFRSFGSVLGTNCLQGFQQMTNVAASRH